MLNINNIRKQISRLYLSSVLGNLSLTGAWVAILAARGYSLVEIGVAETVFHITSLLFEIPSDVRQYHHDFLREFFYGLRVDCVLCNQL